PGDSRAGWEHAQGGDGSVAGRRAARARLRQPAAGIRVAEAEGHRFRMIERTGARSLYTIHQQGLELPAPAPHTWRVFPVPLDGPHLWGPTTAPDRVP